MLSLERAAALQPASLLIVAYAMTWGFRCLNTSFAFIIIPTSWSLNQAMQGLEQYLPSWPVAAIIIAGYLLVTYLQSSTYQASLVWLHCPSISDSFQAEPHSYSWKIWPAFLLFRSQSILLWSPENHSGRLWEGISSCASPSGIRKSHIQPYCSTMGPRLKSQRWEDMLS